MEITRLKHFHQSMSYNLLTQAGRHSRRMNAEAWLFCKVTTSTWNATAFSMKIVEHINFQASGTPSAAHGSSHKRILLLLQSNICTNFPGAVSILLLHISPATALTQFATACQCSPPFATEYNRIEKDGTSHDCESFHKIQTFQRETL